MNSIEQLLAPSAALNGSLPGWMRDLRRAGSEAFRAAGLPTTRHEEWKYTNLAPLAKMAFGLADAAAPESATAAATLAALPALGGVRLVFVNGRFAGATLAQGTAQAGVVVTSLSDAAESAPAIVREHLGSLADPQAAPFVALNAAFLDQGAVVHVARGVELAAPIEVVFVAAAETPLAAHPRVLVVADEGARCTVVERFVGTGGERTLTNSVTEVVLAAGAAVHHVKLQEEADSSFHIGAVCARQAAASHFRSSVVSFGAGLARTEVRTVLDGAGAECDFDGLYVARGAQHTDHQTVIDHRVPHGTSRELYKGVLDDAATGVFSGRVLVREDAQKSDAQQMNKNLLLSDAATVDTKPQLEIFADDVKCAHGATIGRLDEAALFYLRSRGVDAASAREIMIRAFANEMVERLPLAVLRADVERRLGARFAAVAPGAVAR